MTWSLVRDLVPALALFAISFPAAAQGEVPAKQPAFDVASIKLEKDCGRTNSAITPGRFQIDCISTRALIRMAYGMVSGMTLAARSIDVVGGPAWLDSDAYSIAARTEAKGTTADVIGPMLRSLLEDRFQVKVHKEPRETPVYELKLAGAQPNLQPMKEGDCTPLDLTSLTLTPRKPGEALPNYCGGSHGTGSPSGMKLEFTGITMEELAGRMLTGYVDRPVVDKTGLTGRYNFEMVFMPERRLAPATLNGQGTGPIEAAPDTGPTIYDALAKLGLKLSAAKGAMEVIVVDRVERPSEN
ncbi:MAG TPA: TIGR03435 family protein [Bryobacteraceae bacterium]|nr:TIGR03435 family protein [Bryobacteraceae bacterium]